jgi:hypothetical protein
VRKVKLYEVHDEDGVLRKFFTQEDAERFIGTENLTLVISSKTIEPKPKLDLSQFEEAPF